MRAVGLGAFLVAAVVVVAIGVLWSPLGALVGGLILVAIAASAGLISRVQVVRQRTALVICSLFTDEVIRAVPGPAVAYLRPFREKAGPVLDTSLRLQPVLLEDVVLPDLRPLLLRFTAFVLHQVAPETLGPAMLGQLLPYLVHDAEAMVQHFTDYFLRNLLLDVSLSRLDNSLRQELELKLQELLQERMSDMGIKVTAVRIVVRPPTGLYGALTSVEQLKAFIEAMADRQEPARSLALLELARSLGRSGETWTALDVAPWLNAIQAQGAVPGTGQSTPFGGQGLPGQGPGAAPTVTVPVGGPTAKP